MSCGAGFASFQFLLVRRVRRKRDRRSGWRCDADYRIRKDYGGFIDQYKLKYAAIRDRGERVIIDGDCNSVCTLAWASFRLNASASPPARASGFTRPISTIGTRSGVRMTNYWATADMLAYYPETVKKWLDRHGGLTADMKTMKNGPDLWAIVDPCPKEVF